MSSLLHNHNLESFTWILVAVIPAATGDGFDLRTYLHTITSIVIVVWPNSTLTPPQPQQGKGLDASTSETRSPQKCDALVEAILLPVLFLAIASNGGDQQWTLFANVSTISTLSIPCMSNWIVATASLLLCEETRSDFTRQALRAISVLSLRYILTTYVTSKPSMSTGKVEFRILASGIAVFISEWLFSTMVDPYLLKGSIEMKSQHIVASSGLVASCLSSLVCCLFLHRWSVTSRLAVIIAGTIGLLECVLALREITIDGNKDCVWLRSVTWLLDFLAQADTSGIPRFVCLIYWVCSLGLLSIPTARIHQSKSHIHVVISRKWFHFVAIVLFGPTTIVFPETLSLSYAIAISMLVVIEVIRKDVPFLRQFFETYLDVSKDTPDGFLISHIALIFGCAVPLWLSDYVHGNSAICNRGIDLVTRFLPLWGVLCLGVGDSLGAIVGKQYGTHKWGNNQRTLEGSAAMWWGMVWAAFFFLLDESIYSYAVALFCISVATIFEAFTTSIDNIILPLVGSSIIMLMLPGTCER